MRFASSCSRISFSVSILAQYDIIKT